MMVVEHQVLLAEDSLVVALDNQVVPGYNLAVVEILDIDILHQDFLHVDLDIKCILHIRY